MTKNLSILISGGTGFIGRNLCTYFLQQNSQNTVIVLTRDKKKAKQLLPNITLVETSNELENHYFDVIINLAGEPLDKNRWNDTVKEILINSRLHITKLLLLVMQDSIKKPKLFISGSAVGFYGNKKDEKLNESSTPTSEFTNYLCTTWEQEALRANDLGIRVCLLRTGIVLGSDGGALSKMLPAFKYCFGGKFGSGKQWMSWIHLADLIGIINHLILNDTITGPVNATAPNPVTNADFTLKLAKTLKKPAFLNMPDFMLKLLLGEMSHLLLTGQRVIPEKILASGYNFQYSELEAALSAIIYA